MRRIILFTLIALVAGSGAAFADHYRGDFRGRVTFRNPHERVYTPRERVYVPRERRVIHRQPVYVSNGYYQFHNGYRYRYTRPVIERRYFDYRARPQIIVENYQPVSGYVWIPGQWQWNGYEWIWTSGYYQVDPSYNASYDTSYDTSYDAGYYDDGVRY